MNKILPFVGVISVAIGYLAGKYAIIECQLQSKKRKEEKQNKKDA